MAFVDRQRRAREANRSEGYDPSGRNVQRIRRARENRTLNRPPRWDQKLGRDVGTMVRDTTSPFKTAWMHGADLLAQGLGSFSQAEKARVGGKFNAPLNVKKGTSAYNWLLDDVIEDEYKNDFRREVKNNDLFWTELNKYADDEYIGGGQLAKGINARNEGILGTDKGKKAFTEATTIRATDTPAIKEAIATAITDTYPIENPTDVTPPGFGEQLDYDELSGEFFPREAYEQSGVFGRGIAPMSPEESEFQMLLSRDMDERRNARINAIDDFTATPPGDYGVEFDPSQNRMPHVPITHEQKRKIVADTYGSDKVLDPGRWDDDSINTHYDWIKYKEGQGQEFGDRKRVINPVNQGWQLPGMNELVDQINWNTANRPLDWSGGETPELTEDFIQEYIDSQGIKTGLGLW